MAQRRQRQPAQPLDDARLEVHFLALARASGLAIAGEGQLVASAPKGGHYVRPTLVDDVPPGYAKVSFESNNTWDRGVVYPGPWGWFRMVDQTMSPGSADPQQPARLTVPDPSRRTQVHLTVDGTSAANNPLSNPVWRQFRCDS